MIIAYCFGRSRNSSDPEQCEMSLLTTKYLDGTATPDEKRALELTLSLDEEFRHEFEDQVRVHILLRDFSSYFFEG